MHKTKVPNNISFYKNIFYENVRWGDTDGYNHVNNVSITRYFESARVHMTKNLETKKYSFVLVHFNINYLDQIFYPSKIKVGSSLSRLGEKSITFTQALFVHNICKATAESVMAYADIKEKKSYKIDNKIRKLLINKYGASDEI